MFTIEIDIDYRCTLVDPVLRHSAGILVTGGLESVFAPHALRLLQHWAQHEGREQGGMRETAIKSILWFLCKKFDFLGIT